MSRPNEVMAVGGLLCYTLTRFMMAGQLKSAKMFGGENPDGWFGPWFSDTILGLLTPFAIYGAFTGEGVGAWGLLLSFNVLGAYDYMNGLAAQYMHPQVTMLGKPAPPAAVIYGSIGLGCLCQIVNVILLLQNDTIQFFIETDPGSTWPLGAIIALIAVVSLLVLAVGVVIVQRIGRRPIPEKAHEVAARSVSAA